MYKSLKAILERYGNIDAVLEKDESYEASMQRTGGICADVQLSVYKSVQAWLNRDNDFIHCISFSNTGKITACLEHIFGNIDIDKEKFLIITRENTYPTYDGVALGWYIYD